jgi:hypothetical protein
MSGINSPFENGLQVQLRAQRQNPQSENSILTDPNQMAPNILMAHQNVKARTSSLPIFLDGASDEVIEEV